MPDVPSVSVIVPVYNVEEYLPQCLDSLVGQTLKEIEIICVDDGSTDRSGDILKQYAAKDKRVIVLSEENAGPGAARNLGLERASGRYVMFCDPDDWLVSDACETVWRRIAENENDFLYFSTFIYWQETESEEEDKTRLSLLPADDFRQIRPWELTPPFIRTAESWYKIYNRDFLIRNGVRFSEQRLCEDIPFFMKAVVAAKSVSVERRPLYYHRMHSSSLISNYSNWRDSLISFKKGYDITAAGEHADIFYQSFLPYCINSILFWYKRFTGMNKKLDRDFYREMRNLFLFFDAKHDIARLKGVKYEEFLQVVRTPWWQKRLTEMRKKVFQIKRGARHKEILLCGLKIKMKNKQESF